MSFFFKWHISFILKNLQWLLKVYNTDDNHFTQQSLHYSNCSPGSRLEQDETSQQNSAERDSTPRTQPILRNYYHLIPMREAMSFLQQCVLQGITYDLMDSVLHLWANDRKQLYSWLWRERQRKRTGGEEWGEGWRGRWSGEGRKREEAGHIWSREGDVRELGYRKSRGNQEVIMS